MPYVKIASRLTPLFVLYRVLSSKYIPTNKSCTRWLRVSQECLPRNVKSTSEKRFSEPPIAEWLVKSSTSRSLRLLNNVKELKREMLDSTLAHRSRVSVSQKMSDNVEEGLSDEESKRTLNLARCARLSVPKTSLTKQFHEACEGKDYCDPLIAWKLYRENCKNRHAWGEYLRSILDWDWDIAGSLKYLYNLPHGLSEPSLGSVRSDDSHRPVADTWPEPDHTRPIGVLKNGHLYIEAVVDGPVEKVHIPIRYRSGAIAYKTFSAPPSASGVKQDCTDAGLDTSSYGASGIYTSTRAIGVPAIMATSAGIYEHIKNR